MNIDLHTHGKLAKKTDFDPIRFREMIEYARLSGLDAIALTEHFNTRNFNDLYDQLDARYDYVHDYYDIEGFKVFPGIEIDVQEIGHLLMIGPRQAIRALRARLTAHVEEHTFIGIRDLLDYCDTLPLLRIGAHPHRESTPLHHLPAEELRRLDCFDLNGKDLHKYGLGMQERVAVLASEIGLPVVAGSDTHHPLQYGCVMNRLHQSCNTVAELKACLLNGQYDIIISPQLHEKVQAAALVKDMIKQQWKIAQ
ncbi:hypothetical protein FHS18_003874 [Paenibacillus phyllosphaerae]|uniref:Histidinol-phosphatase n=1 Tax=Paenibacillus phyllosphaerae TaxID=274593 RepID=A0A7W5FNY4_9BACL|nr:PHP-associated domain-containing protein [Paenibacillus phyllosphaerae]MBB3111806.1 hypothetical protein [Paenibacillus phyllosphaerae]